MGGGVVRLTYFADTGDWGDGMRQVVYDTTDWSELDWELIDSCPSSERQRLAGQIDGYRRLARSLKMARHNRATIKGE